MCVVISGGSVAAGETGPITVVIDTAQKYQVIEGFGASGAWWPTWVGQYPEADQDRLLRMLFTDDGAALSIYRYNIPAGAGGSVRQRERRTVSIETASGRYDFDADKTAIGFLKRIRELGVERFVLFANSPPARLTINGQTSGGPDGGSNLKPGAEADFARYLVDVSLHLKKTLDLPHVSVSPINEPQWKWGEKWRGQEGCHYTPEQAAKTIRAVIDEVDARGVDLAVEAPESGKWEGSDRYVDAMFKDPVIKAALPGVAIHSYWSGPKEKRAFTDWLSTHYPGKTIAMSEYCEMRGVHDIGMEGALHLAKVMHDDLTIGSVVSWQWWLGIAAGGYADGLIYAGPKTHKIEVTRRLWVMAHYSRFICPGYQRIGVDVGQSPVLASAYLSPDSDKLALVLTNPTDGAMRIEPDVKQPEYRSPEQYWLTDQDAAMHEQPVRDGEVLLPARSIATVVFKRQVR